MKNFRPSHGISTIVNHAEEGGNPHHAHVSPIFMTSTFSFPDVATGAGIVSGELDGYVYSRIDNPNARQLAHKYAILEGLDLIRDHPDRDPGELVAGRVFASGMAAISTALLARVSGGETIIAQRSLYGNSFSFMHELAPRMGIEVVWVDGGDPDQWEAAFDAHDNVSLVYAETPANPTLEIVDLAHLVDLAHAHDAWVMVDNTFATPYCQRPLTFGVDIVAHSTTKYLTGHGLILGGAVVSSHPDFIEPAGEQLFLTAKILGGVPSPFDAWLANVGLKTFELRMQRHNENAMEVAEHLSRHPKIERVLYPGLASHPGHEIAERQMPGGFGGVLSFELRGGYAAGAALMDHVKLVTLAVSLGLVDSLIQHPASMTHAPIPPEERLAAGITDGLVRLSVGVENVEDILGDLDQALDRV
ncbi:MAG: aminotransferase class I/II-fold pyridoxal phosphate-dependent enzyme [Chloroflexi bacterium]|nr:aminotransferase class I/II-fold pyridoxal phosphate-dependent enzyme [Chloroflexota bacterium]